MWQSNKLSSFYCVSSALFMADFLFLLISDMQCAIAAQNTDLCIKLMFLFFGLVLSFRGRWTINIETCTTDSLLYKQYRLDLTYNFVHEIIVQNDQIAFNDLSPIVKQINFCSSFFLSFPSVWLLLSTSTLTPFVWMVRFGFERACHSYNGIFLTWD